VPTAPTSLVATAQSVNQVRLTWTDNATDETQFKIERSTDGKTFYALAAAGANATLYVNGNLQPGHHYYYRIYAINSSGKSTLSNVADVITPTA
jgi:predicted phage tail protein